MLVCQACEAEIAIKHRFSIISFVSFVAAVALVKMYPETVWYWVGWLLLFVSSTFHLAAVPLKIVNAGPNHAKYHS